MEQVPRFLGPPHLFPASAELPEGAKRISFKDREGLGVDFLPDVVYDERDGEKLHVQLLLPMDEMAMLLPQRKKYSLIVYVPGSAWMRQNVFIGLSRMLRVCERGYAVAMVQYRPSDVKGFPAQIEDAKTAIRFMRKNADFYGVDVNKVASWGDSSGGHTVVMAAITDDGVCDNGTYGDYSCAVNCVVDWFGPTDISMMNFYPGMMDHTPPESPAGLLLGGVDVLKNPDLAQKVNPMNYLSAEKAIPPVLIVHGDCDAIVPFNQSVRLYEKLKALGKNIEMYKLEGAGHGMGGFSSDGIIDLTLDYIAQYIG